MDASRGIGCSHVLIYKVLKNEFAIARGWRLEYIPKDDPQCATFKKEIEERIRSLRQSLIARAHDQMLKRKQFVEEAKARRKAEHDEFVRVAKGMVSCAL